MSKMISIPTVNVNADAYPGVGQLGDWHLAVRDDGTVDRDRTSCGILPGHPSYCGDQVDAVLLAAALELDTLRKATTAPGTYAELVELRERVATEQRNSRDDRDAAATAREELEQLRAAVKQLNANLNDAADEQNLCGQYEEFLTEQDARLGLVGRTRSYRVTRRTSEVVYRDEYVVVDALSEDDAKDKASQSDDWDNTYSDADYGDQEVAPMRDWDVETN